MSFEKNVFVNCPFDKDYNPLQRALIFTILFLDFEPKLSKTLSSSDIRITKIKELIASCKYGIHDLSRSKSMSEGELPRFNMPFELGLEMGSIEYGNKKLKSKRILILETNQNHYDQVISDISGQDISSHNDEPKILIKKVRDWFSKNTEDHICSSTVIWTGFNQFTENLQSQLLSDGYTDVEIDEMDIDDYIKFSKEWIKKFKQPESSKFPTKTIEL